MDRIIQQLEENIAALKTALQKMVDQFAANVETLQQQLEQLEQQTRLALVEYEKEQSTPAPEIPPQAPLPIVEMVGIQEEKGLIRLLYTGDAAAYEFHISNGSLPYVVATDQAPPLNIQLGSPLAENLDQHSGEFTGIIKGYVIPLDEDKLPGLPVQFSFPLASATPKSKFLNVLPMGNKNTIELENKNGSEKYGSPHNSQGFGFNCDLTKCADHGGNIYDAKTGAWIYRSPFTGGFQWRQWDSENPNLIYGFDGGSVFYALELMKAPRMLFNLARVRNSFPAITKIWAGRNEGMALSNGFIDFQGLMNGKGYRFSYHIKDGDFLQGSEIDFNYASGEPDFGCAGFLGSYFVKVVKQNTDNTKTPWWIENNGRIVRSKSTFLGHSSAVVTEENGKEIDGIFAIGGVITSCETGETLASLGLGNLSEHVGPVFYKGAKFAVWDDTKGGIYLTKCFGDFETIKVISDAAEGSMDYCCAAANDKETKILYKRNDGKRIVATL